MIDSLMYDMKSITEFITEKMSLRDEPNTLIEQRVFGASQKEDSPNSTELRKSTFITS